MQPRDMRVFAHRQAATRFRSFCLATLLLKAMPRDPGHRARSRATDMAEVNDDLSSRLIRVTSSGPVKPSGSRISTGMTCGTRGQAGMSSAARR